jgi:hypothetical protein
MLGLHLGHHHGVEPQEDRVDAGHDAVLVVSPIAEQRLPVFSRRSRAPMSGLPVSGALPEPDAVGFIQLGRAVRAGAVHTVQVEGRRAGVS